MSLSLPRPCSCSRSFPLNGRVCDRARLRSDPCSNRGSAIPPPRYPVREAACYYSTPCLGPWQPKAKKKMLRICSPEKRCTEAARGRCWASSWTITSRGGSWWAVVGAGGCRWVLAGHGGWSLVVAGSGGLLGRIAVVVGPLWAVSHVVRRNARLGDVTVSLG
jgi:hypothetical protein